MKTINLLFFLLFFILCGYAQKGKTGRNNNTIDTLKLRKEISKAAKNVVHVNNYKSYFKELKACTTQQPPNEQVVRITKQND